MLVSLERLTQSHIWALRNLEDLNFPSLELCCKFIRVNKALVSGGFDTETSSRHSRSHHFGANCHSRTVHLVAICSCQDDLISQSIYTAGIEASFVKAGVRRLQTKPVAFLGSPAPSLPSLARWACLLLRYLFDLFNFSARLWVVELDRW